MNHTLTLLLTLTIFGFLFARPVDAATSARRTSDELSWNIEYGDADRITAITDPAGRTTRLDYELDESERLRKLVRTTNDGSAVIRAFDERGRLVTMTNGAGVVSYGYDDLDRLNRVAREGAPAITYTHDTMDRVKTLQVGDFYRIEYGYDFLGRLASMDTQAGPVRYEYLTGQGKVVRTLPNGIKTIWDYTAEGSLQRITHGLATDPDSNRYRILAAYSYHYRPDGLIDAVEEQSGSKHLKRTYQYDKIGRLVRAKGKPRPQYVYGYDQVGNRTKTLSTRQKQRKFRYDWAGRLTRIQGVRTKHDAAGNLTSMTVGGKTLRYRYNDDNQLAEVLGNASYRYDGDGNLVGRTAGRTEMAFVPDPLSDFWKPLVMEGKGGQRTLVVWDGPTPLMMIRDGEPEYLLHDHLGSVRLVANSGGKVNRRIDYEPYGIIENRAARKFAPRFAGLFLDPAGSIYLTRSRSYSPWLARFMQIDPEHRVAFGSQKDSSIYAYCGGDPVNFSDINGARPAWTTGIYWLTGAKLLFDATGAKKWYAAESERATRQSSPSNWISSGMRATTLDIIGGYIPGEHYNRGQDYASVAWSLATGLGSGLQIGYSQIVAKSGFLAALGTARTVASPIIHIQEGNLGAAAEDIVMFGLGEVATGLSSKSFKLLTNNLTVENIKHGRLFKKISDGIKISKVPYDLRNDISNTWVAANKHSEFTTPFQTKVTPQKQSRTFSGRSTLPSYSTSPIRIGQRRLSHQRRQEILGDTNMRSFSGGPPPPPPPSSNIGRRSNSSYRALSPDNSNRWIAYSSSFKSPSSVGGVYLGGAQQSLSGVGILEGIALDDNGNLVLLGEAGRQIKLPSLRLDDVVTVFRSVYLHGEGPTVTIDPNPKDPEGSAMIIRHGKATENTYVGWVLFQADRLMKGYTLGADNDTGKKIATRAPGYDRVLNSRCSASCAVSR